MQALQGKTLGIRTVPGIGTVRVTATAICSYCTGGRCGPDKFYVYVSDPESIQIVCASCGTAWEAVTQSAALNQRGEETVVINGAQSGDMVSSEQGAKG